MRDLPKIVGIVALVIGLVAFVPLVLIWSLNTLFGLGIGYSLSTWAAAFVLAALIGGSSSSSKR